MVRGGFVVGFGCRQIGYLDSDGRIRKDNKTTDYRVLPDGVVISPEGAYVGEVVRTGKVFDNNCMLLGEAGPDGIVRDANKQYVGCVNPDGTVLDEKGNLIGGVLKEGFAVDYNGSFMGHISDDGLVVNNSNQPIGCVGIHGEVFNKKGGYAGKIKGRAYAFDLNGNLINVLNSDGTVLLSNNRPARLFADNLILNEKNEIVGTALEQHTSIAGSDGNLLGRLFADGRIYDDKGYDKGKITGDGYSFYSQAVGRPYPRGYVVDMSGKVLGRSYYDGNVFNRFGDYMGQRNAQRRFL